MVSFEQQGPLLKNLNSHVCSVYMLHSTLKRESLWNISSIKILLRHQTLLTIDFNQVWIFLIQNNIQLPLVGLLPNNPVITHGFHDDFFILVHSVRQEFQDSIVYFIHTAGLWQTFWNKKQETWATWKGQGVSPLWVTSHSRAWWHSPKKVVRPSEGAWDHLVFGADSH